MESVSIEILENKKAALQKKLDQAQKELEKANQSYESLQKFKDKVYHSQIFFGDLTNQENQMVAAIIGYTEHNQCVKAFLETIHDLYSDLGGWIVTVAYSAFLRMCENQLCSIYKRIEELTDKVHDYRRRIAEYNWEISDQRSKEA